MSNSGQLIKVGVVGARGRMGQAVVKAVTDAIDCDLIASVDQGDDLNLVNDCDVVVDFTTPDVVMPTLEHCIARGVH